MIERPVIRLTLVPSGDRDPRAVMYRVKLLLKHALRACALRCIDIEEIADDQSRSQSNADPAELGGSVVSSLGSPGPTPATTEETPS